MPFLCLGLARTIHIYIYIYIYIRCIYGIFGREITEHTVIYGVYIQFWPTLPMLPESDRLWVRAGFRLCREKFGKQEVGSRALSLRSAWLQTVLWTNKI
jgi:hypothetical protein